MKKGYIWLIQDGKDAGQTVRSLCIIQVLLLWLYTDLFASFSKVPHVHLHIIPKRFSKWFENGIEDINRASRTSNDMKEEAERLKIKFVGS